jgi:hypothetical protein
MRPWRANVDVGSELAKDTIPIVNFLVDVAAGCVVVAAASLADVPLDGAPPDEVLLLLLLDPQPAASTAITATATAVPTVVRTCLLDTTFSSPAFGIGRTVSRTETGVKFEFVRVPCARTKPKLTSSSSKWGATRGSDGKRELSER